ncbi:MAG: Hint domain-containing protein, partial [Pseudorhodobacter sp.]|nr:Hint domain-containing protein [Pseudorhodobacter sp.]
GSDVLDGGSGTDTAEYSASGAGVSVSLATGTGFGGDAAGDTLTGIENVTGSGHADALTGDAGANVLDGGAGDDTLAGGAGADSLMGGSGVDTAAYAASGAAVSVNLATGLAVGGDAAADTLSGIENLTGSAYGDHLTGDGGANVLSGGAGNDTLEGGAGDDTVYAGSGNDHVRLDRHGGHDTVHDFDTGDSDHDGHTNDQFDVSDLVNAQGHPVRVFDVTITGDPNGNSVLHFPGGETVTVVGLSPVAAAGPGMLHAMGIPCFAAGTRILTPQGERAVEQIAVGDLVLTPQGALPVLWHGARHLDAAGLRDQPGLRPIRVQAGHFGLRRDLMVSPQHALLVPGIGLVRARHLAEWRQGARVAQGVRSVTYHHLLLPQHALIWTEGALAESFYPGPMALAALDMADRLTVARIILRADLRSGSLCGAYGPRCQPVLTQRGAKAALRRGKALVAA